MARRILTLKMMVILIIVAVISLSIVACVDKEEAKGVFYSLQEAYDNGILTVEDLQNIAYYQNGENNETDFVPLPKDPAHLSDETIKDIKQTHLVALHTRASARCPKAKIDDIAVLEYYGTYNGAVAVKVSDIYSNYPAIVKELEVSGVKFIYSGPVVRIWQANYK